MNEKKLRILIIQPGIGPYRIDFFNMLAQRCTLKVVYFFENATEQIFPQSLSQKLVNCQVERVDGGFNLRTHYPVRPRLGKVVRDFDPDVVVGYEFNTLAMHLLVLKRLFRAKWKLFLWTSDNLEIAVTCRFPRLFFRYLGVKGADAMLLYSDEVKAFYAKRFANTAKMLVLPNIQAELSIRKKAEAGLEAAGRFAEQFQLTDKRICLYVGRLHPVKNLGSLLEAWRAVARNVSGARLVLIGSGSEAEQLKARIIEWRLQESVLMLGALYGDDLWAWYRLADCLVLPSRFEPFGAVVNEALACGIPCLVSERAGAKVLIESERQGTLVDPDSVSDMADSVPSLLSREKLPKSDCLPPSLMPMKLDAFLDGFLSACKHFIGEN
jgi:glycosyltransferase involved in cell wall biosynthesis